MGDTGRRLVKGATFLGGARGGGAAPAARKVARTSSPLHGRKIIINLM